VGVFVFGRYLRNLRAATAPATVVSSIEAAHPADDDYAARIEKELAER
jgi:hypothetical protein